MHNKAMRVHLGGAVLAWLVLALGCAGQPTRPRVYQTGDTAGRPSVEALPSLDVDLRDLTPEMRMARLLSAECLSLPPPARPSDTSMIAISAWSDGELKAWMREKHARAEAARRELDRAAEQSHRQRIIAGAIVGLVYEDVARTLLSLPVPRELVSEPDIAAMYVDLLRSQAAPYLLQSRRAYTACAGNAAQQSPLQHWAAFCLTREEQLPGSASPPLGAGETTVSVVRP